MRIVRHHQLTPLKSPAGPLPGCRYSSTVPGTETSSPLDIKTSQPPPGGFTGNRERFIGGRNNSSFCHFAPVSCHSFQPEPEKSTSIRSAIVVTGTSAEANKSAARNLESFTRKLLQLSARNTRRKPFSPCLPARNHAGPCGSHARAADTSDPERGTDPPRQPFGLRGRSPHQKNKAAHHCHRAMRALAAVCSGVSLWPVRGAKPLGAGPAIRLEFSARHTILAA